MKVSMIIVCLALVPFVVAQAPTAEADTGFLDWFNGLFETSPVITIKEKAQVVLDQVSDAHTKLNEFITDLELPAIPGEDNYPTIEELDAQIRELSANIEQRIQDAIDRIDFDAFNLENEPESHSEPQGVSEPEPEPTPAPKKWSWW